MLSVVAPLKRASSVVVVVHSAGIIVVALVCVLSVAAFAVSVAIVSAVIFTLASVVLIDDVVPVVYANLSCC